MPIEAGEWERIVAENPDHSQWYVQRFRNLAARGEDIFGEARLIDAMLARGSRVLDAGCGPGRVGGHLHRVGHQVVGVDIDPVLIAAARQDYPGPRWIVANLADVDLTRLESATGSGFDAIVCAGNVLTFVAPSTRRDILRGFYRHLRVDGRAVIGFGAGRGYPFADFLSDAESVGLRADVLLSTWDLRPFTDDSNFLVAVLSRS